MMHNAAAHSKATKNHKDDLTLELNDIVTMYYNSKVSLPYVWLSVQKWVQNREYLQGYWQQQCSHW